MGGHLTGVELATVMAEPRMEVETFAAGVGWLISPEMRSYVSSWALS